MMNKLTGSTLCRVGITSALTMALAATSIGPAAAASHEYPTSVTVVAESTGPESDAESTDPEGDAEVRAVPYIAIITAVIAAGGAVDYMGQQAAQRMYYSGLRHAEYQQIAWPMRVAVFNLLTPPLGFVFMLAFENKLYSSL